MTQKNKKSRYNYLRFIEDGTSIFSLNIKMMTEEDLEVEW